LQLMPMWESMEESLKYFENNWVNV
jgi:hypothetical protein